MQAQNIHSEETESEAEEKSQKRRRWPWIVGGLVALLCLLIILLPTILSTGFGRRQVMGQVNKRLNGSVEMDSWSLGWLSGFHMQNVKVKGDSGDPVFQTNSISMDASIPMLLGSQKDLGTLTIQSPRLTLARPRGGTWNFKELLPKGAKKAEDGPLSFDLSGDIRIENGSVTVSQAGAPPMELRNASLRADIESLNRSISYSTQAELADTGGSVRAEGTVTPMQNGRFKPEELQAEVKAGIEKLKLEPIAALLPFGKTPRPTEGVARLNLNASVSGLQDVTADAALSIPSLVLAGGLLGPDQPHLTDVSLDVKAGRKGNRVQVEKVKLESSIADAQLSGSMPMTFSRIPRQASMDVEASVDIAAIASAAPSLLRLHQDRKMTGGRAELDVTASMAEGSAELQGEAEVSGLTATLGDEIVKLKEPLTFAVNASASKEQMQIKRLRFMSSFGTLKGSGTPDDLSLSLRSDLAAALQEASSFFDVGTLDLAGKASLDLDLTTTEGGRKVTLDGTLSDLRVAGLTPEPVTEPGLSLQASGIAAEGGTGMPEAVKDITLKLDSSAGSLNLAAARAGPGKAMGSVSDLQLEGKLNLGKFASQLRPTGLLPADLKVDGRLQQTVKAGLDSGIVRIDDAQTVTQDLSVRRGGNSFSRDKINVSLQGRADLQSRAAELSKVTLQSGDMKLELSGLSIPKPTKLPAGVTGKFSGQTSLASVLAAVRPFMSPPEKMQFFGQAKLDGRLESGKKEHQTNLGVVITGLRIRGPNEATLKEERVELTTELTAMPQKQTVRFDPVKLSSSPGILNLAAAGTFSDWADRKLLDAEVTVSPDFSRIAEFLRNWTGRDITLKGEGDGKFDLRTSLQNMSLAGLLENTTATAQIPVEQADISGLVARSMALDVNTKDGRARSTVAGELNDGKLDLATIVQLEKGIPVMVMPENREVLSNVQIRGGAFTRLLSRAVPIFRNALEPTGKVDMTVIKARMPLQREPLKRLSTRARIQVADASLKSSGTLRGLLKMADLQDERFDVPDQDISLRVEDGVVRHDEMNINIGGHTLDVSSAVGLDKSLDMKVELPVTRELVGSDAVYALVRGRRLTARIGGTLDDPKLQRDILQENLKSLTPGSFNFFQKDR